jgi:hypothetical protein
VSTPPIHESITLCPTPRQLPAALSEFEVTNGWELVDEADGMSAHAPRAEPRDDSTSVDGPKSPADARPFTSVRTVDRGTHMETSAAERRSQRWWPALRTIDLVGAALLVVLLGWVWWAVRQQDADAGPVLWLLASVGTTAALARWATFFHGTAPAALLALGVAVFAISTGDDLPHRLGQEGSVEAAGALFATASGAAAVVALRLRPFWPRLAFGLLTVSLAALTWITGSLGASLIAGIVLLALLAYLAMQVREPRWVAVWPALVAVLILLGTITYGTIVPVGEEGWLRPDPILHERWSIAIEIASDEPWYGIGPGEAGRRTVDLADGPGWARHEPLQFTAETGVVGGVLLLALLSWALAWIATGGWRRGSSIAGAVLAGSIAHACFQPIWRAPAVPIALAALAGVASMWGGAASWRLAGLWEQLLEQDHLQDRLDEGRTDEGLDVRTDPDESGTGRPLSPYD